VDHVFCLVSTKHTESFTKLALDSFFKHTKIGLGDIFVFVNNDGTNAFRENYPIDIYINNKAPKSWAKNFNKGLRIAKKFSKHFVVITNDIILTKDWFEPLKLRDDVILIPSCNINHNYKVNKFLLGFVIQLQDYLGKEKVLEDLVHFHQKRFNIDNFQERIFMQFYLGRIPYQIHNNVGYFDETFSMAGGEDVDFRIRSAMKGYKTMIANYSYVIHFQGKATWDGCEINSQEEIRRNSYINRAIKKWGKELTDIFIDGSRSKEICYSLGFKEWFDKGESYKIINALARY